MEPRICLVISFMTAMTLTSLFIKVDGAPRGLSMTLVDTIHAISKQLTDTVSDICKTWYFKTCIVEGKLFKDCRMNNQRICEGERIVSPDGQHQIIPISTNFTKYDQTGDDVISPTEFSVTAEVQLQDANTVFISADTNGDGFLSQQEFLMAPIVFTDQMAAEMNSYNGFGPMYLRVEENENKSSETASTGSLQKAVTFVHNF